MKELSVNTVLRNFRFVVEQATCETICCKRMKGFTSPIKTVKQTQIKGLSILIQVALYLYTYIAYHKVGMAFGY